MKFFVCIRSDSMKKILILSIVSNLAIGAIICAPSLSPASSSGSTISSLNQQASNQSTATKQSAATTSTAAVDTKPKSSSSQFSPAASSVNGSPSIVNVQGVGQRNQVDEMEGTTFDGKNPFADDSLWQIPISLVRDLSVNQDDQKDYPMAAKSSNLELSSMNDDDDDTQVAPPAASASTNPNHLLSLSSPTVISASTTADLKTAAGYHYPSAHEHHGGYGEDHHGSYGGGHHGGHHGGYGSAGHHHGGHYGGSGDHYGGKYFQYASVPYPGAWEFGYRRGNPYHTIERYEHGKGPHFKTKVKWSDKYGGYGVHVWDFNHDDHHSHHYGGHYDSHAPAHYGGHHGGHHYEGHH